jgi:hypothetical protein
MDYYDAVRRYYRSHHGTHPDRINVLNIQVQEESRPRAFRLLDTIIKVLRSRKHDIIADHFTTYAKIGDEHVKFRLREKQRKRREEQEKIERELKERLDKEAHSFKKLFLQAIRLHQTNILRNYIQTVETNAVENGTVSEELKTWMNWAEKKVSWYDPLINDPDPLLIDHHKTHLLKEFFKEWQ